MLSLVRTTSAPPPKPTTYADLVVAKEMKARIEVFKRERLGGKKREFVETIASNDKMDLSQG